MNKENILYVADLIENQPLTSPADNTGFTMQSYLHSCGTPACIAGWAYAASRGSDGSEDLRPEDRDQWSDSRTVAGEAQRFLGLDYTTSEQLFLGFEAPVDLVRIKPEAAVAVLRHLAETGEVDWENVGGYEPSFSPEFWEDVAETEGAVDD